MNYIVIFLVQFSFLCWGVEYIQFSERTFWLRKHFWKVATEDLITLEDIIKKGKKLPNTYINRVATEFFTCPVCFCKYTSTFLAVLSVLSGNLSIAFLLFLFGVPVGMIIKKINS